MDAGFLQGGSHSDLAVVKLGVMDVEEAPIFSSSEYSMETREGAAGNTIGVVNAHDPDTGHSPIRSLYTHTHTHTFTILKQPFTPIVQHFSSVPADPTRHGSLFLGCFFFPHLNVRRC